MFVLKKNTSSHAVYPYYLDDVEGDRAMSSIDLAASLVSRAAEKGPNRPEVETDRQTVTFRDESMRKMTLVDYLSIPPPRTLQLQNLAMRFKANCVSLWSLNRHYPNHTTMTMTTVCYIGNITWLIDIIFSV